MAEEAIFSFVLDSLRDLVTQEAQFLHGVEDQVRELEEQLNQMRWFLRDTSSANPDEQKRVLEWVLRARDFAYEAENLVESYAIKVASRRRGGIQGTIKRIAGVLKECYHRHQIGSDIETLISKISDLTTGMNTYGIRQIMENRDAGASRRALLRRTYSTVNDEDNHFVGSDDTINMLAEKLVSEEYRTVSLYGMGGLGKTTLARKVYHHSVITKHFDGFSWISISQQWQKDDILRGILIKLMPDQKRDVIQKWRDEELVRELSQFLRTTKCLLVLDDIWSIDAWESIESAIPSTEKGSKVLLTTRNREVATFVDPHGYNHSTQLLTPDESWELLCSKARRDPDSKETIRVEKIGKEMIAQCGGLPLAVVALGGILSSKLSYEDWKSVYDNIKSYLKDRRGQRNVQTILALSYDDLPFQLKPCFLYLSKYAEDAEIEVETLYQYWLAEGMVSSEDKMGNNETLMDVAEHYLNELAERCMVFVQKEEEEHSFRRFKSCRLHDLMRDLCISKAKDENFLESPDYANIHDVVEASSISKRSIRRLSISLPEPVDAKRYLSPVKAVTRSLRSFSLYFENGYDWKRQHTLFKLNEFVMLRVLSLEGIVPPNDVESFGEVCTAVISHLKILSSICKLVHLRYLSLKDTFVFIMPTAISNLKQLQTLDLRGEDVMWISNVLWKLPQLHHLYLPELESCRFAKKLGFDGLHKLEILEGFHNKVCNVNHLSTLTNLRKLTASVKDELEDLEELIQHVGKLSHLRFLELSIEIRDLSSEKGMTIISDVLSCSSLVTLVIDGTLSKFPEYSQSFGRNLQSLRLVRCRIEEDPLSTLERLPNLRTLSFLANSFDGKEMSCHANGFPELRFLELYYLEDLEKWEIEDGAMPNLSELTIWGCSKLEMIPPGLRCNTLLKKLKIVNMPEEFENRVLVNEDGQEGADFDNVRHVQTIQISL